MLGWEEKPSLMWGNARIHKGNLRKPSLCASSTAKRNGCISPHIHTDTYTQDGRFDTMMTHLLSGSHYAVIYFLLTNMFQYSIQGRNMNENYKPC